MTTLRGPRLQRHLSSAAPVIEFRSGLFTGEPNSSFLRDAWGFWSSELWAKLCSRLVTGESEMLSRPCHPVNDCRAHAPCSGTHGAARSVLGAGLFVVLGIKRLASSFAYKCSHQQRQKQSRYCADGNPGKVQIIHSLLKQLSPGGGRGR